ncbi:zinc finger C-x8-C-x5-C-x3-H type domain-containing, putative [Babesia ovis]|uniref:Zinc finger C-x8-C-x5-C-x3-H type domain-containing, putative n=1 Tax=Babesia ovis TaxID=5869 RepID=A0A9W5WTN9_BABOV|nr:zinc finger C-x8-C-x5-C-x3-H type domain-containing, putative [Babesia ovis]
MSDMLEMPLDQEVRLISVEQFYKTKLCPHMNKPEGCLRNMRAECPYAHNQEELKEPPNLIKTALCKSHMKGCCDKTAKECPYAHSYHELRHTEGFYKTYMCKFWQKGYCKAGEMCRYAHGEHELRKSNYINPYARVDDIDPGRLISKSTAEDDFNQVETRQRETTTPTVPSGYCYNRNMVSPMYVYPFYGDVNPYCPTPTVTEVQPWMVQADSTASKEREEAYCLMHFYLQKYIDCCSKQQSYMHSQLYLDQTYTPDNSYKN